MRKLLDFLYNGAAALASLFMVGLLAMVLLSIVSRQLHFNVPGSDAYARYLMAGAGFLALAHTLKRGEHIRITLVRSHVGSRVKSRLERWAMGAGAVLALLFAFFSVHLAWNSHAFNDISTGNDAPALWIPQIAMAIGIVVMSIAYIDEFILEWRGHVARQHTEALRHE